MIRTQIIEQRELLGKDFKIYGTFENPLFLAKDVANWIEHSDVSMMLKSIDADEKLIQTIFVSGQNREMWFLTEDGLYEVLMQSRKPIAKVFKKEIKKILKSIRKNGFYGTPQKIEEILNDPRNFLKTLEAYAEEKEKNKILQLENNELKEENKIMKPKSIFADSVQVSKTSILIGELAKILKQNGIDIGQNRLFEDLRKEGYLIKSGSSKNLPTQKAMELNLFKIKESTSVNKDGSIRINRTTKVTGKGQIYFINKYYKKYKKI